jgi:hypothetical protein
MYKTYQNAQIGFEIDIPEDWSPPPGEALKTPFGVSIMFQCGGHESCNIQIGQTLPESLNQIEQAFRRHALKSQYTDLEFGTMAVGNKDHLWARYRLGADAWFKKFIVVLGNTEYDITATCYDRRIFLEREPVWDKVVQSLRLRAPEKPKQTSGVFERMQQASHIFETGYGYFRSGQYREALEQFEKGKLVTQEFPGNFLGTSMTIMQMIETGAIPEEQFAWAVTQAEQNLKVCLLINPREKDYINVMNALQDFKKKHNIR